MEDDPLLRVDEVAERLRVSEETVRRMLRAGRLRGVRLGSTKMGWRIPASELARLLGKSQSEHQRRLAA